MPWIHNIQNHSPHAELYKYTYIYIYIYIYVVVAGRRDAAGSSARGIATHNTPPTCFLRTCILQHQTTSSRSRL